MNLIFTGILTGCTSVTVKPLDAAYKVKHLCIRENPKVVVEGFVYVVTDGFNRHHISTEFIPSPAELSKLELENEDDLSDEYYMNMTPVPESCDFSLTYTARRSWDFVPYLTSATISIYDKKHAIASADYHLRGKGGYSLLKWQSVKTKIDPVMDELLQFYK
jgi:hypothetical protein